jgi:lipopolysaccharide export system permease protein
MLRIGLGERAKQMTPRADRQTGIVIDGQHTIAAHRRIENACFRLPHALSSFGRQIVARQADYQPPNQGQPGGYLLDGVNQPENLADLPSVRLDGKPVILSPHDVEWLKPNQCFVTSNITFEHLAAGRAMQQYASTASLVASLRNPSLDFGADTRVTLHARFVQPLLDVTLLFLALPLVLRRSQRNFFVAAGQCLLLVLAYFVVTLTCQTMGNQMFLFSPALAALEPFAGFWTGGLCSGPAALGIGWWLGGTAGI